MFRINFDPTGFWARAAHLGLVVTVGAGVAAAGGLHVDCDLPDGCYTVKAAKLHHDEVPERETPTAPLPRSVAFVSTSNVTVAGSSWYIRT